MQTQLQKQIFHLFSKNLVFLEMKAETPVESTESEPSRAEERLLKIYDRQKERLEKGTEYNENPLNTFKNLVGPGMNQEATARQILIRYSSSFENIKNDLPKKKDEGTINSAQELWQEIKKYDCKKVAIVKENGQWLFKFTDSVNQDIFRKMSLEREGVKVNVTINQKKIAAQEEAIKSAAARETARSVNWDKDTGIVTFPGNAEEKWKQTLNVSLNTLFPDAQEGALIQVTAPNQRPKTAKLTTSTWQYPNGERAKIFDGYKVIPLWNIEQQEERPAISLRPGERLLEQQPRKLNEDQLIKAKQNALSWNEIARDIINTKPELTNSGISVEQYAHILKQHSTDTGYYWVVMPQVKPSQEAEHRYNTEVQRTSTQRVRESRQEQTQSYALYDKYKKHIWEDIKLVPGGNVKLEQGQEKAFRDIIESESKWKEAWNAGKLLDSAMIMRAFQKEPYNKIPETTIRDTLREVMDYGLARNGISMSYFFEAFNKEGKLYKTLDGKPATFSDLKDEYQLLNETIPKKIQENKDNGKAINYGFDEEETKAWQQMSGRKEEIMNILVGAAVIFDSIFKAYNPKTASDKPEWVRTGEAYTITPEDKKYGDHYRMMIVGREKISLNDNAENAVQNRESWNKMWDNNEGNVEILKRALQRPPYNNLGQELQRDRMYNALKGGRRMDTYNLNMSLILRHLNKDGELYRNSDAEPGNFKDFLEQYKAEQIGDKVRKGTAKPEELNWYNQQDNKNELGNRYEELSQLYISTAYVLNAVEHLDPTVEYAETVPAGQQAQAMLTDVFPPSDTGSTKGRSVDYYDTANEKGFSSGFKLFRYDLSDVKLMSELDEVSSSATAHRIILDQCRTPDGKIDKAKFESRMNELIKLGIINILTKADKTENQEKRAHALNILGVNPNNAAAPNIVSNTIESFKFSLDNTTNLSQIQKELIRLGFILETKVRPGEVREVRETPNLSDDPQIRQLQLQMVEQNVKAADVEKAGKDMLLGIAHMKIGDNFSRIDEVGFTVAIPVAGDDKNMLYVAISPAYDLPNEKLILRGGLGGSMEIAKNVALLGAAGVSTEGRGYVGAGVKWEIPVDKDTVMKPNFTIGGILSADLGNLSNNQAVVGLALSWHRDREAQYREDLAENIQTAGLEAVEKETNVDRKAALLLTLPGPTGAALSELKVHLNLSNQELVNFYNTHIKRELAQETRKQGLSEHKFLGFLPPVTDVGFGVALSLDPRKIIPGVGFAIAIGSKLVVFQKPQSNTADLQRLGASRMEQQAKRAELIKAFNDSAQSQGYTTIEYQTFQGEEVVGDREAGFKPVKTESHVSQLQASPDDSQAKLDQIFEEYNQELAKSGLRLEKAGDMYKLVVNNIGNVQIYMDPAMREKMGLFIKNGEIYLSASKNPNLVIKRLDLYYPRPKEGNIKHTFITISDANLRTVADIMNASEYMIESRTKDNTGPYRTPYRLSPIAGKDNPTQINIREWKPEEKYGYFDNLNRETAETRRYRQNVEQLRRHQNLGKTMRENIGSANLGIDMQEAETRAKAFIEKNPRLYRDYTTYQLTSEPQLQKLDDEIKQEYPGITDDELYAVKEELFHLSMAESKKSIEKLPPEQQKERIRQIVDQRLNWMEETIYVPFFEKHINKGNNPNGYTAKQLANALVGPMRFAYINEMQKLPIGAQLEVAVGTLNIRGRRQFTMSQPDTIEDHGIRPAKDYSVALETGQPPIDRTIALILRESVRPVEQLEGNEILRSPLAVKLLLLGTNQGKKPVMLDILGEETYKKLSECYAQKPPTAVEGSHEALTKLEEIAKKLSEAQEGKGTLMRINEKNYFSIEIKNTILGIRTDMLQSGIYERCFNATSVYNDEIIAISKEEKYDIVGNARVYRGAAMNSLVTSNEVDTVKVGFGAAVDIPLPDDIPPPTTTVTDTPTTENAGGGGEVAQADDASGTSAVPTGSGAGE
jgi:hypothetical protein